MPGIHSSSEIGPGQIVKAHTTILDEFETESPPPPHPLQKFVMAKILNAIQ